MSHSALIDDLRTRGEQQINAIRQKAREEIEGLRADAAHRLAEEDNNYRLTAEQTREAVRRRMAVAAQRRASVIATQAEQELDHRLYALARGLMTGLLTGNRAALFVTLAREIPAGDWRSVAVHPDDVASARQIFPQADIVADDEMAGGLIASSADGGMTVINTLAKRLERLWPRLAPEILRDVVKHEKAG
jgi:vacuolar-type H+-ATPase subunit E/Vma4